MRITLTLAVFFILYNLLAWYWVLLIGVVAVSLFLDGFFASSKKKKIDELILSEENFNVSHKYVDGTSGTGTAVDLENKKIIFIHNKSKTVINFNDLISVETIVNDEATQQTKRGSQVAGGVVGGLLLGPVGLLAGALTGKKKVVEKVSKISLKALVQSIDKPYLEIVFYEGSPIKLDSALHNIHSKLADEWVGRFSAIINMEKN